MKKHFTKFVVKCLTCQHVKVDHKKSGGFSEDISIPNWKWRALNMDFIVGLPCTRQQHNSIKIIMDCMIKLFHFILFKVSYLMKDYVKFYLRDMVRLHGVPLSIIYDRCTQFTSQF